MSETPLPPERRTALLSEIIRIQGLVTDTIDAAELFQPMLDVLVECSESPFGFIGETCHAPDGTPFLRTHAISAIAGNPNTQKLCDESPVADIPFRNLQTLFECVITTRQPVICNAPATDPRFTGLPSGHPELTSLLGLPIHRHGRIIGMVGVANRAGGYSQELAESIQPILTSCSFIIESLRLAAEREASDAYTHLASELNTCSQVAVFATDTEGRLTLFNRDAETMLGYAADQIVDQCTPVRFHDPRELEDFVRTMAHETGRSLSPFRALVARADDKASVRREWTYVRSDGTHLLADVTITAIRDRDRNITGYFGVAIDVTAAAAVRQKLQNAKEAAETADPGKSESVADISHEIRSLLNSIPGREELLLQTSPSEEQREHSVASGDDAVVPVTLPESDGEQKDPPPVDNRPVLNPLNILLADDHRINTIFATRMLKKDGHNVTAVVNGREAVDHVVNQAPDLILMDVQMPVMDGLTAIREIREHEAQAGGHIPIIALTAHALNGYDQKCYDAGADGYLSKPLRADALRQTLSKILSDRSAEDQADKTEASPEPQRPQDTQPPQEPQLEEEASDQIINPETIRRNTDNDDSFAEVLITVFREDLGRMIDELNRAIEEEDVETAARLAHSFKSPLDFFGASDVRDQSHRLEQLAKARNFRQLRPEFDSLCGSLSKVEAALCGYAGLT